MRDSLNAIDSELHGCRKCPRLVAHREEIARVKRRAFRDYEYWGRPVPAFGGVRSRVVLVGLAPGAHGSNRTGRMFTGDASGDFLFPALHRAGLATKPTAVDRGDGMKLRDCFITAPVRCAPPGNKPTREEFATCLPYMVREMKLLTRTKVYVAFGKFGFDWLLRALTELDVEVPREPKPTFGHLAEVELPSVERHIVCSYHPSRQNTQTGRLTREMFDAVFTRASALIEGR
jgi:uracil-DNA glycosylase family 4